MGPEKQPQELTMLIDKLVGTWDVEMTVKLVDGAILRGKGKLKAQEIVDGFGVRTEETRRPFEKGKIEVITISGLTSYRKTFEPS